MPVKVPSCQGVAGSPVIKLGSLSFRDLKNFNPSSISSAGVLCGMFLSYQQSMWHLHVFLCMQFSHKVKTDTHNVFVVPFGDISLLLKDFFWNYFWTTAFFFLTVAHMAFASPWEDLGDLLSFPIRHRMCVLKEGEYICWSIPTDVICWFFCSALSLCCLFVKSYISQFVPTLCFARHCSGTWPPSCPLG